MQVSIPSNLPKAVGTPMQCEQHKCVAKVSSNLDFVAKFAILIYT